MAPSTGWQSVAHPPVGKYPEITTMLWSTAGRNPSARRDPSSTITLPGICCQSEGCRSGRTGRSRKPLCPYRAPWVRIPLPPPPAIRESEMWSQCRPFSFLLQRGLANPSDLQKLAVGRRSVLGKQGGYQDLVTCSFVDAPYPCDGQAQSLAAARPGAAISSYRWRLLAWISAKVGPPPIDHVLSKLSSLPFAVQLARQTCDRRSQVAAAQTYILLAGL